MDARTKLIGAPLARVEDPRLLTGTGTFTDDAPVEGALWGVVVRAPEPHGRLASLDVAEARAMPGVAAVLTADDAVADGLGELGPMKEIAAPDGGPMRVPWRRVLAGDRVRHLGEPIAFVLAETLAQARDAAEAVLPEIEALPAVTELEAIRDGRTAPMEPDWPDNIAFRFEKGDAAAAEAGLAEAARVVRLSLKISRVQPTPLEPRAALAQVEPDTGRLTLTTPTQAPWRLRDSLARVLGAEPEALRVISPDMGGGFGNRSVYLPEHVLVLWAARRLGRAVRWRADRGETFLCDDQARHSLVEAALGLDANGRFTALTARTLYGVGAYHSQLSVGPATNNVGVLAGVYRIPAIHVQVDGAMLNVNPAGAYRGAGRPEACYVLERLVDTAARETGIDPVELRRRNMIPQDAMPYRTALTYTYDSGDFAAVMDRALALADRDGFADRRAEAKERGRLRGLGMACSIESAGSPSRGEQARLKLREDGGLDFVVGTHSHGQGHETAFRQVLGDALGLAMDDIGFAQGDTDALPAGGGTASSRSSAIGGGVAQLGALKLIKAARSLAGDALEVAEQDVEFDAGRFRVVGTDRAVGWRDVAAEAARQDAMATLDVAETYSVAKAAFPNSCAVAEVEVDPETGAVTLAGLSVVGDYGVVLNPMLLEGQLHGGVAQGAGQILLEEIRWDPETGQLLSGSFMDYAMPRATDLPPVKVGFAPTPTEANVLGAKGAGEAGTVASLPAVMNAVVDALAPLGVRTIDMPASPANVWAAIRAAHG